MRIRAALVLAMAMAWLIACKHEPPMLADTSNYPDAVSKIIIAKCAVAGCHNDLSKEGAGGLSLETWNRMFEGTRGGAVVIPYRPDYSTLMYYINTDSTRAPALQPTMPYNTTPLSEAEYNTLKDWIAAGAPDKNGFVKFSDNPQRRKFYAANQGCDVATVFDAASMLAMRVVTIGDIPTRSEAPHMIKVAPNNQFYCVSFIAGSKFQKFSTADNTLVGQVELGEGSWNTFSFTADSRKAYTTDLEHGNIAVIDLDAMTVQIAPFDLKQPHGTALNEKDDTLYITAQTGNFLYKFAADLSGYKIITVNGQPQSGTSSFDPHEILFSADYSRYYLTCQKSNEVRVMNRANDALLAVIPVGGVPQEMGLSKKYPYLFVSCMEDLTTFPGRRGSVYVIDYNTNAIVAKIYTGHQPHGIAVDDTAGRVYISNRNVSADGPAPHHSSVCGGRNGYITAIDLQTLTLVPDFKSEVSVDPYGMGITH